MKKLIKQALVLFLTAVPAMVLSQDSVSLEAEEVRHNQSLHQVSTTWTDQNDRSVQLRDFRGEPLVVVMFYGQCSGTCPVLIKNTWDLYSSVDGEIRENVNVLAVSFDYRNDTPATLKQYAAYEQLDLPGWHFVTAEHAEIRELAMLLGVQYREREDGHFEHTNLITVLDKDGKIATRVEGLSGDMEKAIEAIESVSRESGANRIVQGGPQ